MKERPSTFNHKDVYEVLKNTLEVDSDVNEDRNREALLDGSLEEFIAFVNVEDKQK